MIRIVGRSLLFTAFGMLLLTGPAMATNAVKPGQLNIERPTLISEGFDWRIDGDDNRNSSVAVKFRKKGARDWQTGLPFLRAGFAGLEAPPWSLARRQVGSGLF